MATLFLITALIAISLVSWLADIDPLVTMGMGFFMGLTATLFVVRSLGRRARKSALALSIMTKLTAYRVKRYSVQGKTSYTTEGDDDKAVMGVLRDQMKLSTAEIRDAMEYIANEIPDESLDVKVYEALKYFGNGNKQLVKQGRSWR